MARIVMKGLPDAIKHLGELADAMAVEKVKEVLLEAIDPVRAEALRNVQTVTTRRTGALEGALVARKGKSKTTARAWLKADDKTMLKASGKHAHLIEYGHRMSRRKLIRNKKADTRRKQWTGLGGEFVKERPFFRPALASKRREARSKVKSGLAQLIVNRSHGQFVGMAPEDLGWVG